uniref:Uncharacterized protein n=1 Tax=Plectus sambesii TaxID=2011161 RepID=A0A914VUJ8_9BILA
MQKVKESVILRENVLIGMAKTYMKLHDPQGLKSVWKMLMAEDIILFSKAIGSIRDYFRRLSLAPPEVDEKKICIQPHHR